MSQELTCPSCGEVVVTTRAIGGAVTCPGCERELSVPTAPSEPPPLSAAAPPRPRASRARGAGTTPHPPPRDRSWLFECDHIEPIRAANVIGLVYGAIMIPIGLLMAPFLIISSLLSPESSEMGIGLGVGMSLLMLLIYPVMGAVSGWIGGALGALVYNFVAKKIGGIRYRATSNGGTSQVLS